MLDLIRNHKRTTITIVVVLILGIALTLFLTNLPDFMVRFLFETVTSAQQNKNLFAEDGLYVITTGTGAPMPDPGRAGPQTVVVAGGRILVFDTGPGSTHKMEIIPLDLGSIDALFMTHYHSDHIGDLGELMLKRWGSNGNTEPLPIYGPPGVEAVVEGFMSAYRLDETYRVAHHGTDVMPPAGFGGEAHLFDLGTDLMASEVVYQSGDVEVIAFNVDHTPIFPAVGYRVNYKDRSVVISGDTVYTESLTYHTMGADVFISEALNHEFSQMLAVSSEDFDNNTSAVAEDIQDYHITPGQAGMVARDAGVSHLVITHVLPPVPSAILVRPFLRETRVNFDGAITMANDGTMIFMPVSSDKVIIKELLK
jgi:ribonuclease Z